MGERFDRLARLSRAGFEEPGRVPSYLLGKLFPNSRWGHDVVRREGYLTFREGAFSPAGDRPSFSAKLFYEVQSIERIVDENDVEADVALQVGCGYGRLTPWFASHADEFHAIEPNGDALSDADSLYPDVAFVRGVAGSLPYPDDTFDLIATWGVLQLVADDAVVRTVDDLARVCSPSGHVLLCEMTAGKSNPPLCWVRSRDEYRELFEPMDLVDARPRGSEPTARQDEFDELLLFG